MKKIIIIEGGNQCGKTTLANKINDEFGPFEYIKCNQPKNGDAYSEYMYILEDLENNPRNAIIDRFHLGSMVYGPLYRGKYDLFFDQFVSIENKIFASKNLIIPIIAYTNIEFIQKAHLELEEEYLKFEDIEKEIDLFKYALATSSIQWYHHDIVNQNLWDSKFIHNLFAKIDRRLKNGKK